MHWFDVREERLRYRGRIDRAPFAAWFATAEGTKAIEAIASRLRFQLFGKRRAAKRDVWRAVKNAAQREPLRTALQAAADEYGRALSDLPYGAGLPRTQVALRRVVVVPRVMLAARARARVAPRVLQSGGMPDVDEAVRTFFLDEIVAQLDAATRRVRPSPSRPLRGAQEWTCIGIDDEYVWVDPYWSGPGWFGHLFVYEWPAGGVSRRDRKALEAAVKDLQASLAVLSRQNRHELVKAAAIA
jgi:hypothetical protein